MNRQHLQDKIELINSMYPELINRYMRGIEIYLSHRIAPLAPLGAEPSASATDWVFEPVEGQNFAHRHFVHDAGERLECSCPDFFHNAPEYESGDRYCKHVIAATFFKKYGEAED